MSRSNYDYYCDNWALIRWRGAVSSAIRGKRGQSLLREMRDALDSMPEKRLIAADLVDCVVYRPVLPWPDSAGWWWVHHVASDYGGPLIVEAYDIEGMMIIIRGAEFYRYEFERHGPARFVKLRESNPFGETND